jgi:hypothetical protein
MMSIAIGSMYASGTYAAIIVIVALAITVSVFAFVYRKKIMAKLNSEFDRLSKE